MAIKSVGTNLREAREKQGFTLEQISAHTRITTKCLTAIERDSVGEISSPFIYRSFVRQYAEHIGLEFQPLAARVEAMAESMRQPDLPGQGEHQPVRVAPIQPRVKRDFTWLAPVLMFVGAVVAISGGYEASRHYRVDWSHYVSVSSFMTLFNKPVEAVSVPKVSVIQQPPPVVEEPKAVVEAAKPDTGIHLELAATERTWLSATADGKTAYSGILEKEEVKVLDGQESAQVRTGNAAGVNITFNGKPIGAIGPRGTTRTVVVTKTGFEVIQQANRPQFTHSTRIGG
jgi:hypothetical protein